ncbi:DUF5818 domain-containing protein [Novosphingobium sp.]|uniref:DUF5818 domain-containing protein n=1 Tax=Novosphingobium sp. TaxID=1874826 RepID=UPI0039C8E033
MGSRHDKTGWLTERDGQWIWRRVEGSQWRLDVGFWTVWRSRKLIGKRVHVLRTRGEFDLLNVDRIEQL